MLQQNKVGEYIFIKIERVCLIVLNFREGECSCPFLKKFWMVGPSCEQEDYVREGDVR